MGLDSQNADKSVTKIEPTAATSTAGNSPDLGASMLRSGDNAAKNYGKGAHLGDLPTSADLLKQIDQDQKANVTGFDRQPFNKERELVRSLSADDLKNIGSLVDTIKHGKLGESGKGEENLGDAIKRFQKDPAHLVALKDALQLELERQKLDKHYQIDVMGYKERSGKDAAVLLVSNTKDQSSIGITTDGKKAPNELLKFLYD
jgi:hypothetical protein